MSKIKLLLTVGISNSGKSTFAKELTSSSDNWIEVNRDTIRASHFTSTKKIGDYKYTKAKEGQVTELVKDLAIGGLLAGLNVIVSDTNLNESTRNSFKEIVSELNTAGYSFEYAEKAFDVPPHVCWKRSQARGYTVPKKVINGQYKKFRQYMGMRQYTGDVRPNAVIFDIDGTLAKMQGRSPYDWDRVGEDLVNERVSALAQTFFFSKNTVILLSGRDSCCRRQTEEWLATNHIHYHELYMRPEGSTQNDADMKEDLFWKHVADRFNVQLVVDDRTQVVDRWRAMGLECWQVADGDF